MSDEIRKMLWAGVAERYGNIRRLTTAMTQARMSDKPSWMSWNEMRDRFLSQGPSKVRNALLRLMAYQKDVRAVRRLGVKTW